MASFSNDLRWLAVVAGVLVGAAACDGDDGANNGGGNVGPGSPQGGGAGTPAPMSGQSGAAAPSPMAAPGGASGNPMPTVGAGGTTPTGGVSGNPMNGAGGVGGGMGGMTGGTGPMMASGCVAPQTNASVGNDCPGTPPPAIQLTMITDGLIGPTYVAQAPGDPSRLYVLEQQGTVRVVHEGQLQAEPVLDLRNVSGAEFSSASIIPGGYSESGLLGMVFDPGFEQTSRLWLSFTTTAPEYKLAELTMSAPGQIDASSYREVLSFEQFPFFSGAATNHVGSMLAFGPDGCLYLSRGDGGGENDRQGSGQDTSDDLCSILRIDIDNYPTEAPGNHDGHVWNYGFRNPWRFTFDRATGDMYIGDVGQDVNTGFEEINIEPRGVPGRNYGWRPMEGTVCRPAGTCPEGGCTGNCDGMTTPALAYGITSTQNSVIGGYVYRGSAMPEMVGRYIWADWTEREIKTLVYAGDNNGQAEICDEHDTGVVVPTKVRSFGEGIDGEIYVVSGGAPSPGLASAAVTESGFLYRIDPG